MNHWDGQVIGLPGTIDNDLGGTDFTIGYFTALDTALDAIDKVRDTAEAFDRIFLVEVMGRKSGDIAMGVGISGGAEEILVPEDPARLEDVAKRIIDAKKRGKVSYIIIVAEGYCEGGAFEVARRLNEITSFDAKPCVLGHIQRGGSPIAHDRFLGTRLGVHSVISAMEGANGVLVGVNKGEIKLTPFDEIDIGKHMFDTKYWMEINEMLTR
jgi:6-phosphofructokinase 1